MSRWKTISMVMAVIVAVISIVAGFMLNSYRFSIHGNEITKPGYLRPGIMFEVSIAEDNMRSYERLRYTKKAYPMKAIINNEPYIWWSSFSLDRGKNSTYSSGTYYKHDGFGRRITPNYEKSVEVTKGLRPKFTIRLKYDNRLWGARLPLIVDGKKIFIKVENKTDWDSSIDPYRWLSVIIASVALILMAILMATDESLRTRSQ